MERLTSAPYGNLVEDHTAKQLRRIGNAVRELRGEMALSQEKFAEAADIHRTYISQIEAGAVNLSFHNLSRIARAGGITVAALMERAKV